ncbi:GIY-YIG nuclease family protein [Candidatus Pelagibacter sp.]|jgi:putative endonuclease|nr:GIY-YIG nuclease family protein [Candidatus Pelagibacter sp.]
MSFFVYMILSKHKDKFVSYVGYTNNIKNRISLHNSSKGAKFTKGKKWKLIYFKKYQNKVDAMKNEYKLKKDYKLRLKIKKDFIKNV